MNALLALGAGLITAALVVGFIAGAPRLYWRWRGLRPATPTDPIAPGREPELVPVAVLAHASTARAEAITRPTVEV